jgi:hypothetical protein
MDHQETLFPGENLATRDYKLTRLARTYRTWAIQKESHIAMVGCIAGTHLLREPAQFQKEVDRMIDFLIDARLRLIEFRVAGEKITGYFPYQIAPIAQSVIVATAHDSPAKPGFPGYRMVPPTAVTQPGGADAGPKGQFIIDPFAKKDNQSIQGSNLIHATVEVMIWDGNSSIGRKLPDPPMLTLKAGPSGLQEVGGELAIFKQRLFSYKFITKAEISVKIGGKVELDEHQKGLIKKWGKDIKSSLSFEMKIGIKLKIEASVGVDSEGKVTPGLLITILEFD